MDAETFKRYRAIFEPRSVAVVGASNVPGKWGFIVPMNIFMGGYKGAVYLINPKESRVLGCESYPSLRAVGSPIDLVLITVPAPLVAGIIKECGKLGISSAVVISAGFSETGEEGRVKEYELTQLARECGVLFVGPNCMGVASPPVELYAIGASVRPGKGKFAFLSQSGNLGVQMLGWGEYEGVGFSRFVSSGNEAMAGCDGFLDYFGQDPTTEVIILYLESVRNGEKFFEVARQVSLKKPILALKVGDTEAGAKAARSHSGALAGSRDVFDAMCKQAGIVQASTTEELIDLARSFGALPVPKGDRVGIMTLGGGWGVVTTDKCAKEGLTLPELRDETREAIEPLLPAFWSRSNPVDLVGITKRSTHFAIAEVMARAEEFDSLIFLGIMLGLKGSPKDAVDWFFGPVANIYRRFGLGRYKLASDIVRGVKQSLAKPAEKQRSGVDEKDSKIARSRTGGFDLKEIRQWRDEILAERIIGLINKYQKPIIAVAFSEETAINLFRKYGLVSFSIPEKAVRSLAKLTDYGRWLRKERERLTRGEVTMPPKRECARSLLDSFLGRPTEHDAKRLLLMYDVPIAPNVLVRDVESAVDAGREIGYPVVMKVMSPDIPHKTEARVVMLGVQDESQVRSAYEQLLANAASFNPSAEIKGILIEKMISGGVEVFVGVKKDPQFGPVMMMGLGGVHVEVMRDVSRRVLPVHPDDCVEMIREIKGSRLLAGYRGSKPADKDALADVLWKISNLAMDFKEEIAEIDLNPIMVLPEGEGCVVVDSLLVLS